MRLLVITQKVDRDDPVLGFFHDWISEFAKAFETIRVVCLGKGIFNLPINVNVFSLGKENGASRLRYVFNFYQYIWNERKNYDVVFVHMNQEYILLGAIVWRILGKKVFLWRNHPSGTILTQIAVLLSDKVFCTSVYSYTARYKKTSIMPVGINTKIFFDDGAQRELNSILSIGRISPVKDILAMVKVARILVQKGWRGVLYICGTTPLRDESYGREVAHEAARLVEGGAIRFEPSVPYSKIPGWYNNRELYINLTKTGSFDKTIFEAMACGMLVLVSNLSFDGKIPEACICREGDPADAADKAVALLALSSEEKKQIILKLKLHVENNQSLVSLTDKLVAMLE